MGNWQKINVEELQDGTPGFILWGSTKYKIDTILDSHRDVLRKTGRIGIQYLVLIRKQRRLLFRDVRKVWFVSKVEQTPVQNDRRRVHCCVDLRGDTSHKKR